MNQAEENYNIINRFLAKKKDELQLHNASSPEKDVFGAAYNGLHKQERLQLERQLEDYAIAIKHADNLQLKLYDVRDQPKERRFVVTFGDSISGRSFRLIPTVRLVSQYIDPGKWRDSVFSDKPVSEEILDCAMLGYETKWRDTVHVTAPSLFYPRVAVGKDRATITVESLDHLRGCTASFKKAMAENWIYNKNAPLRLDIELMLSQGARRSRDREHNRKHRSDARKLTRLIGQAI